MVQSKAVDKSIKGSKQQTEPSLKQLSHQATLSRAIPYPKDSEKHKELVDAVTKIVCCGLQPTSVVDETSFRKLMAKACPKFNVRVPFASIFFYSF